MTTLDVEPVRIRTEEYDRMTEVGLFDGRHIDLLEGMLYEMPPMRTPRLIVLVRLQQMLAPLNAERRLLVQIPFGYRTSMSPSQTSRCCVSRLAATSPRRPTAC